MILSLVAPPRKGSASYNAEDWNSATVISDDEEVVTRPKKRVRSEPQQEREESLSEWYVKKYGSFREAGLFVPSESEKSDEDQPDPWLGRQRPDGRYETGGKAIPDPNQMTTKETAQDFHINLEENPLRSAQSRKRRATASRQLQESDSEEEQGLLRARRAKQNGGSRQRADHAFPTSPPTNSVYADGIDPVPQDVQDTVDQIKSLRRKPGMGYPMRVPMRKMKGIFDGRMGFLLPESILMSFYGDTRLFTEKWWKFMSTTGAGEWLGKSDEPLPGAENDDAITAEVGADGETGRSSNGSGDRYEGQEEEELADDQDLAESDGNDDDDYLADEEDIA